MDLTINSIRTFIGAKDYIVSRQFYTDIGFKEFKTSDKMSYFRMGEFGFYLQDAYVKDWIENSMIFLEVRELESVVVKFKSLRLDTRYEGVRMTEIHENDWGREFFMHDPSGVLWHVGDFKEEISF